MSLYMVRHRPLLLSQSGARAYCVGMDIILSPGAHLQWRSRREIELQVCTGRLWLTLAGEAGDRFLEPGDCVRLPARQAAILGVEGPQPLRLLGRDVQSPVHDALIDMAAWRCRALRQREVAKRWWWRACRRLLRRWFSLSGPRRA